MASEFPVGARPVVSLDRGPSLLTRLISVRQAYDNELDQQRAVVVSSVSLVFGLLGMVGLIGLRILFPPFLPPGLFVPNMALGVAYLVIHLFVQRGRLRLASFLFAATTLVVPLLQGLPMPVPFLKPEMAALGFAVSIVASAFLLGSGWALVATAISILLMGVISLTRIPGGPGAVQSLLGTGQLVPFMVDGGVSAFLLAVLVMLVWLLSSSLFGWASSAQRRARLLEAGVVVSETAATAANLSELLVTVVERIREAYGFYHAQVFLLDQERRTARLEASTGRAGEALLTRGHSLEVGSQSIVGQCSLTGDPVVVNNVAISRIHRPNPLLPNTAAELSLALTVAGTVIGVLDVQSTEVNAFQPEVVSSLQIMATQLASAIDKARLVDELQVRAVENERLFEEAERSLHQIEDLNRRFTREGWTDYLRARRLGTLGYTLQGENVRTDVEWTAPMRQAYQGESSVVIRHEDQAHIAAVPLRVHGEVIGVLEMERGGNRPWRDTELNMLQTLVDRLSLAIENARLFEQATQATEREQIVNRISQGMQEAASIDEVLQSALAELSEVLGASRGVVQISPKKEAEAPEA